MTSHPLPAVPKRSVWWTFLKWTAIAMAASVLVLSVCIYNLVTLTRDASALRNDLFAALQQRPSTRIQLSAGPVTLALVRTGLGFIPQVPAEAHEVLNAVRAASVGVYEFEDGVSSDGRTAVLAATNTTMTARGWLRVVGVNDGDATVSVYVPDDANDETVQRVCVAVCEGSQVIIVAATADIGGLARFADAKRRIAGWPVLAK